MRKSNLSLAVPASLLAIGAFMSTPASADPFFYSGYDSGVGSSASLVSSIAAAQTFDAAAAAYGFVQHVDLESTPRVAFTSIEVVPGTYGMTITGSYPAAGGGLSSMTNITGSQTNYSGFNTTPGGENYNKVNGGYEVFSFATPTHAFGAFITGVQNNASISFDDGTSYTVRFSDLFEVGIFGGAAFIGVIDPTRTISSVTITISNQLGVPDTVGIDDMRYTIPVPEASTDGMLAGGLLVLALVAARRSRR